MKKTKLKNLSSKKIGIIDLFAGCGGLTDGFEQEGNYKTLAAVEWVDTFCRTLAKRLETKWRYNSADKKVLYFDMQRSSDLIHGWKNDAKYGSNQGLDYLVGKTKVDLIIGGPPCQAYSIAGRIRDKHGMQNDYRNYLFESYLKLVEHYKPDFFLFENVMGILSAKPGGISIIDRIRSSFSESGYEITDRIKDLAVFDVSEYGIPQYRKRVILLGINKKKYGLKSRQMLKTFYMEIIPSFRVKNKKTVKDAISDLPSFFPSKTDKNRKKISHLPTGSEVSNHYPRYHNSRDIEIFKELAADIHKGSEKYITVDDIKKLYTLKTGKVSNIHKYYVLRWDQPSNAIVAHLYKDGLRHIHPDFKQARSITVREAARLQSFDDDFEFLGSMGEQYQMIGNAVPPKFALILAKGLRSLMEMYKVI